MMQSTIAAVSKYPYSPLFRSARRLSEAAAVQPKSNFVLEQVSCAAVDGAPPAGAAEDGEDLEYYSQHKASPLAEIELADTRKPITQATAGTAYAGGGSEGQVIGWKEEQLDTAEEALLRATRIWKESAMRGDPDSAQSRVLRALRGEDVA